MRCQTWEEHVIPDASHDSSDATVRLFVLQSSTPFPFVSFSQTSQNSQSRPETTFESNPRNILNLRTTSCGCIRIQHLSTLSYWHRRGKYYYLVLRYSPSPGISYPICTGERYCYSDRLTLQNKTRTEGSPATCPFSVLTISSKTDSVQQMCGFCRIIRLIVKTSHWTGNHRQSIMLTNIRLPTMTIWSLSHAVSGKF
jgi:hypothetical protein